MGNKGEGQDSAGDVAWDSSLIATGAGVGWTRWGQGAGTDSLLTVLVFSMKQESRE